ncbi:membrane alanyl aminopeptidase-like isoform X3 [Lucilia cuprina]|uniref:membrane alanyl aminopeptidase-like isoform X3 n=1 Tax=Lucilia cuprina TaxID=7375 RepID=UPI001F0582D6|nr:membrane alanyl aminopeptidase-like isoform X3 [Lucilia cuprina]
MWFSFILPIFLLTISAFLILLITSKSPLNYRLNKNVKPHSYDIQIQPYLLEEDGIKKFSFAGEVNITLWTSKDFIKQISVHKNDIDIKTVRLYDNFHGEIQQFKDQEMIYVTKTHQLFLNLLKPLKPELNYTLNIKYSGNIRNDAYGLFRFSYDNISWQALTLLQPIGARLILPCFDEPEFKAKFRMKIIRPYNYRSFFNTKLLKTVTLNNYVSYGDNEIQMIAPIEIINKTYFSYEVFVKSLNFCNSFFPMTYQQLGNTLMQATITNKYKYLAVENWGLIVFRDYIIYQIPYYKDDSVRKHKSIGTIIHEVVHMWFGNSVTLKWWSHFWLNEAFARYFEIIIGDMLYPFYKFEQQFVINKLHSVLDIDAKTMSEPLTSREMNVNTPLEINSKLNRITYEKGAAVLRMFSNAMGRNNFNKAMRDYVKENHLKNTQPQDVFKQLRNYWPKNHQVNLKEFFQDWTEQPGYPLLIITITKRREYLLKQQRFLIKDMKNIKFSSSLTYTIPITYTTDKENDFQILTPKFYFNKTLLKLIFGNADQDKWLILNLQQSSYCRVLYDSVLLERLRQAFLSYKHSGIHVINRASMINDLFTFAREGLLEYKQVFHFMEYLAQESEYLPWRVALKELNTVRKSFNQQQRNKFAAYISKLLDIAYRNLGFEKSNISIWDK